MQQNSATLIYDLNTTKGTVESYLTSKKTNLKQYSSKLGKIAPNSKSLKKTGTFRWLPIVLRLHVRQGQKQSNLRAFKGKRQCFSIFYDVNMRTKAKLTVNFLTFPSVKLRKICHTGYLEYFALVGACFYERNLSNNFFCSGKRHKLAKLG